MTRAVIGLVLGLGVGLLITVVVIFARVGFFVDSPRAAQPYILVAFFAVPTLAGAWLAIRSGRR